MLLLIESLEKGSNWFMPLSRLLELIVDTNCLICNKGTNNGVGRFLCQSCINNIEVVKDGCYCYKCSLPFNISYTLPQDSKFLCEYCRSHVQRFGIMRFVGRYNDILKELIGKYKFERISKIINDIDYLIKAAVERFSDPGRYRYVLYIPLHKNRLKERGFDQSYCLAKIVSLHINKPILLNGLIRGRDTSPQTLIEYHNRAKNLKGAFITPADSAKALKDANLLLVDDVYTTGATINEAIKVLKKAGAREVDVFVLARGLPL